MVSPPAFPSFHRKVSQNISNTSRTLPGHGKSQEGRGQNKLHCWSWVLAELRPGFPSTLIWMRTKPNAAGCFQTSRYTWPLWRVKAQWKLNLILNWSDFWRVYQKICCSKLEFNSWFLKVVTLWACTDILPRFYHLVFLLAMIHLDLWRCSSCCHSIDSQKRLSMQNLNGHETAMTRDSSSRFLPSLGKTLLQRFHCSHTPMRMPTSEASTRWQDRNSDKAASIWSWKFSSFKCTIIVNTVYTKLNMETKSNRIKEEFRILNGALFHTKRWEVAPVITTAAVILWLILNSLGL